MMAWNTLVPCDENAGFINCLSLELSKSIRVSAGCWKKSPESASPESASLESASDGLGSRRFFHPFPRFLFLIMNPSELVNSGCPPVNHHRDGWRQRKKTSNGKKPKTQLPLCRLSVMVQKHTSMRTTDRRTNQVSYTTRTTGTPATATSWSRNPGAP